MCQADTFGESQAGILRQLFELRHFKMQSGIVGAFDAEIFFAFTACDSKYGYETKCYDH